MNKFISLWYSLHQKYSTTRVWREHIYSQLFSFVCACAVDDYEKKAMQDAYRKYNQRIYNLIATGRYEREDFTVVIQEHLLNAQPAKKVSTSPWVPEGYTRQGLTLRFPARSRKRSFDKKSMVKNGISVLLYILFWAPSLKDLGAHSKI